MIWLLLGWCHVKLLPSRRTFCIHHRVYNYTDFSKRACGCSRHARIKGDDRADRLAGNATIPSGLRLRRSSVEELEKLPLGTKPRTSHHHSPWRERRGKRKRSTIFLKRTREGQHQSDPTLARFQRHRWGKFWVTGWNAYGFSRAHKYHLEFTWMRLLYGCAFSTWNGFVTITVFTSWTWKTCKLSNACLLTYKHTHTHTYARTHLHTYRHVRAHARIYTHTHTVRSRTLVTGTKKTPRTAWRLDMWRHGTYMLTFWSADKESVLCTTESVSFLVSAEGLFQGLSVHKAGLCPPRTNRFVRLSRHAGLLFFGRLIDLFTSVTHSQYRLFCTVIIFSYSYVDFSKL